MSTGGAVAGDGEDAGDQKRGRCDIPPHGVLSSGSWRLTRRSGRIDGPTTRSWRVSWKSIRVRSGATSNFIDCTVRARVVNDGVQFSLGHHQSVSQQKTVFLGSLDQAAKASTPLVLLIDGGRSRLTKTLVTFEVFAHSDALEALKSKDRKYQQGCKYFQSLAIAHLDFLNLLINSYRRLSSDPFATEVSAWDVPVWSLSAEGIKRNLILFPYLAFQSRPSVAKVSKPSEVNPYIAASLEDIERVAGTDATPGDVELLDGWSLYYRGRHADSIRS